MLEVWNRPDWTSNNVTCVAYSAVNSTEFINHTVIIDAKGRLNKAPVWVAVGDNSILESTSFNLSAKCLNTNTTE